MLVRVQRKTCLPQPHCEFAKVTLVDGSWLKKKEKELWTCEQIHVNVMRLRGFKCFYINTIIGLDQKKKSFFFLLLVFLFLSISRFFHIFICLFNQHEHRKGKLKLFFTQTKVSCWQHELHAKQNHPIQIERRNKIRILVNKVFFVSVFHSRAMIYITVHR